MVQVVENLTQLTGRVQGVASAAQPAGFDVVTMDVESAEEVPGKANLLASRAGTVTDVLVRHEPAEGLSAGTRVRLRASLTSSGNVMAEPHPAPGDFTVEPF